MNERVEKFFANNPQLPYDEVMTFMLKAMKFYKKQARKHLDKSLDHKMGVVDGFYNAVDKSMKEKLAKIPDVKCKKGCAFCCKIPIEISLAEAQYIYEICKENNIPIDTNYLKSQVKLKEEEYILSEFHNCVFLGEDNSCLVYEVRPICCRRYYVISDPQYCNAQTLKKHQVAIVQTLNEDAMALGLIEADRAFGSLPEMLLKAIELDKNGTF